MSFPSFVCVQLYTYQKEKKEKKLLKRKSTREEKEKKEKDSLHVLVLLAALPLKLRGWPHLFCVCAPYKSWNIPINRPLKSSLERQKEYIGCHWTRKNCVVLLFSSNRDWAIHDEFACYDDSYEWDRSDDGDTTAWKKSITIATLAPAPDCVCDAMMKWNHLIKKKISKKDVIFSPHCNESRITRDAIGEAKQFAAKKEEEENRNVSPSFS